MRIALLMIVAVITCFSIALATGQEYYHPPRPDYEPISAAQAEKNSLDFESILKDSNLSKDFTGTYQVFDSRTEVEKEIEQKLSSTMLTFNHANTPLHEVITNLSDKLSVNVYIDEKSLSEEGIPIDEPITLNFKNPIRAEAGVNIALEKLGLTCYATNDTLTFTTKTVADEFAIICTYDVRGLGFDTQGEMTKLISIITNQTGDEFAWDAVGGVGSIQVIPGGVIVSQTPKVHNEIKALLDQLQKFVTSVKP